MVSCLFSRPIEISFSAEFNLSYVQRTGFPNPVLIKEHRGLGLRVPTAQFTVDHVRSCVGSQRLIDVMNVDTQQSSQMTMKAWTDYFNQPAEKRTPLLNVISLEFSHTNLENYVESPDIVKNLNSLSDRSHACHFRFVSSIGRRMHGQGIGWMSKHTIREISNKIICIIRRLASRIDPLASLCSSDDASDTP